MQKLREECNGYIFNPLSNIKSFMNIDICSLSSSHKIVNIWNTTSLMRKINALVGNINDEERILLFLQIKSEWWALEDFSTSVTELKDILKLIFLSGMLTFTGESKTVLIEIEGTKIEVEKYKLKFPNDVVELRLRRMLKVDNFQKSYLGKDNNQLKTDMDGDDWTSILERLVFVVVNIGRRDNDLCSKRDNKVFMANRIKKCFKRVLKRGTIFAKKNGVLGGVRT